MRYGTGVVLVLLAGVLWSLQGLMIRQISEAGSWSILFWRSLGAVPVLLAFVAWRAGGSPLASVRAVGLPGLVGGLGLVCAFAGILYAFQATTVANAMFVFSAAPFIAALLAWLVLGERVGAKTWAAMAVAMAGFFVMVRGGLEAGAIAGNVGALVSATGFAVFTVSNRWGRLRDNVPVTLLGSILAVGTGVVASQLFGQTLAVPMSDILWAMFMGAFALAGGLALYTVGSRAIPAAESVLLSYTEVVLAPLWVWIGVGEAPRPETLIGGAIILAAVIYSGMASARTGQLKRA